MTKLKRASPKHVRNRDTGDDDDDVLNTLFGLPPAPDIPAPIRMTPHPPQPTYNDFFDKVGKHLLNEKVIFKNEGDKKALHIALQTIERLRKEDDVKALFFRGQGDLYDYDISLQDNLINIRDNYDAELRPQEKSLIKDWIDNNRVMIKDIYGMSTKQVNNTEAMQQSKYMEGYLQRENTPIYKMEDMTKFHRIYWQTESEVVDVYKYLFKTDNPERHNVQSIKALKIKSLEGKSDKYIESIIKEYHQRNIREKYLEQLKQELDIAVIDLDKKIHEYQTEIDNMKVSFQIGQDDKPYLWTNQIMRHTQLNSVKAKQARTGQLPLDTEGKEYKMKVHEINENVKSFILGKDDALLQKWYMDNKIYEEYEKLKQSWKDFTVTRDISIHFEDQKLIVNTDFYTNTADFTDIETFQKSRFEDNTLSGLQAHLQSIYDTDLYYYKRKLLTNDKDKHININRIFLHYKTRYGVMAAGMETIKRSIDGLSEDLINSIIKGIDFIAYSKKPDTRVRSHKIVAKAVRSDGGDRYNNSRKSSPKKTTKIK